MRRNEERYPMRRSQGFGLSPWSEPDLLGSSSVFGGSPWQTMRRMQEDMDRLFSGFFGPSGQGSSQGSTSAAQTGQQTGLQQWAPSVDISESQREWCIEADLPGVNKDQIEVQVQDNHLIMSAEMRSETGREPAKGGDGQQGESQRQYHRRERRYGYFQRVIPLPENVNEDQISCDFKNGVLTVHVPKAQQAQNQPRRIPIQDMVEQIPSETASGRMRSEAELEMTEDTEEEPMLAGAKGGETSHANASGTSGEGATVTGPSTGAAKRTPGGTKTRKTTDKAA